jgi:hypothetical protein
MGIAQRIARRTISTRKARQSTVLAASVLAASAAIAAGAAGAAGAATAGAATKAVTATPVGDNYQFVEVGSHHDRTFNQLLGINNEGVIAGYFGLGSKGHPNKGYVIDPPFAQGDIHSENYPHSVQTQVTGLNDKGVTVGFFSTQNNASNINNNFGWYASGGHFHEVNFPTGTPDKPPVDQLLGVNNHDIAVGFFTNSSGINRGYTYNIAKKTFTRVLPPGASGSNLGGSLTAAAINDAGDVAGSYNKTATQVDGFLRLSDGKFITLAVPGASATQALGVNNADWVAGFYMVGTGSAATTHGFVYKLGQGYTTNIDDPNGIGTTTINGINNENDLVGFYTDSAGNVDGFVAFPGF